MIDEVTDDEIMEAYRFIARHEGVFGEPACAASVAGLIKNAKKGLLKKGQTIVCTLTGNGLKDPDNATKHIKLPPTVKPEKATVLRELGLK